MKTENNDAVIRNYEINKDRISIRQTKGPAIILHNEIKLKNHYQTPDIPIIRERVGEFVRKRKGLHVIALGKYTIRDTTSGAYPLGDPERIIYDASVDIYHIKDCTINVHGDWMTNENTYSRFGIYIYGKKENVQKISKSLEKMLGI